MKNFFKFLILIAISLLLFFVIIYFGYYDKAGEETVFSYHNEYSDKELKNILIINEISPNNHTIIKDETLNFSPYIELCNNSENLINLNGFGLSDEFGLPYKWTFKDEIIKPHECMIVFCDGKNLNSKYTHTNFKLNPYGGGIVLSSNDGQELSKLIYDRCLEDITYCLVDGEYEYCKKDTMFENTKQPIDDYEKYKSENINNYVLFSEESGFFDDDFRLEISTNSEIVELKYTTDGSNPNRNSKTYTEPIVIDSRSDDENIYVDIETTTLWGALFGQGKIDPRLTKRLTVVKAQCFVGDTPVGQVYSKTYYVYEGQETKFDMPVVSLVVDDDDFYSEEKGIYVVGGHFRKSPPSIITGTYPVNYMQRGELWERECKIEFFEDNKLLYSKNAGVSIFGNDSRHNAKKSLEINADYYFGTDFNYDFFKDLKDVDGNTIDSFSNIVLRSGGHDSANSFIRDSLTSLVARDYLDVQYTMPVVLFVNSEYFGIYFVREHLDEKYVQNRYHIDDNSVTMIKGLSNSLDKDFHKHYEYVEFAVNNDLSIEKNMQYMKDNIDMENLIEFHVFEMYISNTDYSNGDNTMVWRAEASPYNKFRYIVYDTDFAYGLHVDDSGVEANFETSLNKNMFDEIFNSEAPGNALLLKQLIENETFKEAFFLRYCDRLNSTFVPENIISKIEDLKSNIEFEVESNNIRYAFHDSAADGWYSEIDQMILFANLRPDIVFDQMAEFMNKRVVKLNIKNLSGGNVIVNDIIETEKDVSLRYLEGMKVELVAKDSEGYEFVGWSNGHKERKITIQLLESENNIEAKYMEVEQ